MYEKVEICPICDNDKFTNYIICKDHLVSYESFAITQCTSCQFLLTNPRPSQDEISKYYKSDQYVSHTSTKKGIINKIYHIVRKKALNNKLKLINSLQPKKGKLLDIGCGTGHFLSTCKANNWTITGIEVDPEANHLASTNTNETIYPSLESLPEQKFDVITLWHVLEHVHDLTGYITRIKSLLSKTGSLIIAVPNHDAYDRKHYKENWAAYDLPRHLYHFDKNSMAKLVKKHGLKLSQTLPMKYDSFYVSLLSEKYITGKSKLFKAYKLGKKSNNEAKQTNNYSSLIYVIKY